ncbi:MAG: cytidine deaminase [Psychromonas sp.]|nr:cytidine deaminase [Psychromonas sp.]
MKKVFFKQLVALLDQSSAPYSKFNVSAIVLTTQGHAYNGVNVESAAYPTTICAERNAIHTAVTQGMKKGEVSEVHLLARNPQGKLVLVYPCGGCRQVIAEQSNAKAYVYCYDEKGEARQHAIDKLLPHAFLGAEL